MKENVKNFKFCHFTQIPELVPAWKNNILHTSKSVFPNETETRVKNSVDLSGFNIKVPNLLDKVFEKERMIDQEVSDRFFNKRRYVEELIGEAALQEQLSMNLEQEREKRQAYEAEGLGEEDIAYMRQKEREEFLDSLNKPLTKKEKSKLTQKGKFIGLLTGEADNNKIARSVQKKIAGMEFPDLFNDNKVRQVIDEAVSKGRQDIDMRDASERKRQEDADVERMKAEKAEKAKEDERTKLFEEVSRSGDGFVPFPTLAPEKDIYDDVPVEVGAGAPAGSGSASGGGLSAELVDEKKREADIAKAAAGSDVFDTYEDPIFSGSDGAKFAEDASALAVSRGEKLILETRDISSSLKSASGATVQAQAIRNEITNEKNKKENEGKTEDELENIVRKKYGFPLKKTPTASAGKKKNVASEKVGNKGDRDLADLKDMAYNDYKTRSDKMHKRIKKYEDLVNSFDSSKVNEEKLIDLYNEASILALQSELEKSATRQQINEVNIDKGDLKRKATRLLSLAAKKYGFKYPGIKGYTGERGQTEAEREEADKIKRGKRESAEREKAIKKEMKNIENSIKSINDNGRGTKVNSGTITIRLNEVKKLKDEELTKKFKELALKYSKIVEERIQLNTKAIESAKAGTEIMRKLKEKRTGLQTELKNINEMTRGGKMVSGAGSGVGAPAPAPKPRGRSITRTAGSTSASRSRRSGKSRGSRKSRSGSSSKRRAEASAGDE